MLLTPVQSKCHSVHLNDMQSAGSGERKCGPQNISCRPSQKLRLFHRGRLAVLFHSVAAAAAQKGELDGKNHLIKSPIIHGSFSQRYIFIINKCPVFTVKRSWNMNTNFHRKKSHRNSYRRQSLFHWNFKNHVRSNSSGINRKIFIFSCVVCFSLAVSNWNSNRGSCGVTAVDLYLLSYHFFTLLSIVWPIIHAMCWPISFVTNMF